MKGKVTALIAIVIVGLLLAACETPGVLREKERTQQAMQNRAAQVEMAAQQSAAAQAAAAAEREAARARADAIAAEAQAWADVEYYREQGELATLVENNAQEIRRMQQQQTNFEQRLIMLMTATGQLDEKTIKELRETLLEEEQSGLTFWQKFLIWLAVAIPVVFVTLLFWRAMRKRYRQAWEEYHQ